MYKVSSWQLGAYYMNINMTHNENIVTFDDIARHLELKDERLKAASLYSCLCCWVEFAQSFEFQAQKESSIQQQREDDWSST